MSVGNLALIGVCGLVGPAWSGGGAVPAVVGAILPASATN